MLEETLGYGGDHAPVSRDRNFADAPWRQPGGLEPFIPSGSSLLNSSSSEPSSDVNVGATVDSVTNLPKVRRHHLSPRTRQILDDTNVLQAGIIAERKRLDEAAEAAQVQREAERQLVEEQQAAAELAERLRLARNRQQREEQWRIQTQAMFTAWTGTGRPASELQ